MGKAKKAPVKSVKGLIDYMQKLGLDVSKSKVYRDIETGVLIRQATGRFREEDLATYADTLRKKPGDAGQVDLDRAALEIKKLQMDIARLEGVVRKQDRDFDIQTGKLCKSGDFYLAIAERLSILRSRFNTMARVRALEYVKMSPDDFVDAITQDFAVILHEFSRPPEYDAEEVPDVFKGGADVAGKTEKQDKKHGGNDED